MANKNRNYSKPLEFSPKTSQKYEKKKYRTSKLGQNAHQI